MKDEDWKDIEPILLHAAAINGRRNDIFHHGATAIASGQGLVTNASMALTESRINDFPISPELLDDMTADLKKILLHFHIGHMGRPPLCGKHDNVDEILRAPWRHKLQPKPRASPHKSSRADRVSKKAK